jgi:nitroimidazol reductase NimA-like FMN-containing flavoprotein (pyridoxamine 5'-phosphate oxidase superfamily)
MRAMTRNEFEMSMEEARSILAKAEYGVLSTAGNEGMPYGVPMNHVLDGDEILLHCATEGHKLDNIRHNSNVCFTVVGKAVLIPERSTTAYESVIAFGKASVVTSEGEKKEVLRKLVKRFLGPGQIEAAMKEVGEDVSKHGVIRIKIVGVSGKSRD